MVGDCSNFLYHWVVPSAGLVNDKNRFAVAEVVGRYDSLTDGDSKLCRSLFAGIHNWTTRDAAKLVGTLGGRAVA